MGFFEPSVMGGGVMKAPTDGPYHNFVVVALMVMKFGTGIKLDVLYTMATKSVRSHYYYIIMTS